MNSPNAHASTNEVPILDAGHRSVTYVNSLPEYLEGRKLLYGYQLRLKIVFFLTLVLAVSGFMIWNTRHRGEEAFFPYIFLGGFTFVATVIMPFMDRRSASQWFRGDQAARSQMRVIWDGIGITITNDTTSAHCRWQSLHQFSTGKLVIAMNWNNGINIFLPNTPAILQSIAEAKHLTADALLPTPSTTTSATSWAHGIELEGFTHALEFNLSEEQQNEAFGATRMVKTNLKLVAILSCVMTVHHLMRGNQGGIGMIFLPVLVGSRFWIAFQAYHYFNNRKIWKKADASAWNGVLRYDEASFSFTMGSRSDIIPWSDVARIDVGRTIIQLLVAKHSICLLVPNDARFRDLLRDRVPQHAKSLK